MTPQRKRIFAPSQTSETTGTEGSLYAQDKFEVGERWNLHLGLRLDQQTMENDVGVEVDDSSELAPRLAAVFDVNRDGKVLVRASAGRYYQNIPLAFAFDEYSRLPTGTSVYDEYDWNPATRRYDRFRVHVEPGGAGGIKQVEHPYKDEVTAGVDWQFTGDWALKSRLVWHESDQLYWGNSQYTADGKGIVREVRNWPQGYREYQALTLEVNRRYAGGWSLQSNLTVGNNEGNVENLAVRFTDDEFFAALGGIEVGTGRTDATTRNHDGRFSNDQDRLNIVGMKNFQLGRQTVTVGGFFYYATGAYVGKQRATSVRHPVTQLQIDTITFDEPRDAHQIEDIMSLNLSGSWSFPIWRKVEGLLGLEVANVTDEQEVILVNLLTLEPISSVDAYQPPRELRLKVGVRF